MPPEIPAARGRHAVISNNLIDMAAPGFAVPSRNTLLVPNTEFELDLHSSDPTSGPCPWPSLVGTFSSMNRSHESEQRTFVAEIDISPLPASA